jgi:glycosyltransferase involved in cell wall biosynthesis
MLEGRLEIFIITYNRASKLETTLSTLSNSVLKNCKITILNNCSSDDTLEICRKYVNIFSNMSIVTHSINIGSSPNLLRSFELSKSNYTWILCDDDFLSLEYMDDVFQVIEDCKVDLIHVGAHPEPWSFGGTIDTPSNLMEKGYHYFKYSSFLPNNIIKTQAFTDYYMIEAYNNCVNAYPHMPFIQGVYSSDHDIYISKYKILTATVGEQSYDDYVWLIWWINTSKLIKFPNYVRMAFLDHFNNQVNTSLISYMRKVAISDDNYELTIENFVNKYFLWHERLSYYTVKYMSPRFHIFKLKRFFYYMSSILSMKKRCQ